jgi:hypothetical protein
MMSGMPDTTVVLNQMTKASQDAHAALDAWMNDAGGDPQDVDQKVQTYRTLRQQWLLLNQPVMPDNAEGPPPSEPPGPEEDL